MRPCSVPHRGASNGNGGVGRPELWVSNFADLGLVGLLHFVRWGHSICCCRSCTSRSTGETEGTAHTGPALTPVEALIAIHDINPKKDKLPYERPEKHEQQGDQRSRFVGQTCILWSGNQCFGKYFFNLPLVFFLAAEKKTTNRRDTTICPQCFCWQWKWDTKPLA